MKEAKTPKATYCLIPLFMKVSRVGRFTGIEHRLVVVMGWGQGGMAHDC